MYIINVLALTGVFGSSEQEAAANANTIQNQFNNILIIMNVLIKAAS